MATGIGKHEKHSVDALTASSPQRDPYPLPDGDVPVLQYSNRLSRDAILRPLATSFVTLAGKSRFQSIPSMTGNAVILADNLFALHALLKSPRKATLIYMDPPYATGLEFHSRQLEHAYRDQLSDAAYVEAMRRRLVLAREALTDDGSIYVHIGFQMVAHMKVIMDEIFGARNFRNIITRRKCSSKNFTKHQYANLNDFVLFYTKTDAYKWNQPAATPDMDWILREYPKVDSRGRYKMVPIHAPGTRRGETGKAWRGMLPPPGKHWQYTPAKLEELDQAGEIHWSKNGNPRRKIYLTADKSIPLTDYWDKYRDAHHQSIAVSGYPTEKNLAMLKMMISASSDAGDLVLDPFCGSGTTLHAAADLGRQWIGMDESFAAVKACLKRLRHGIEPMGDFVETKPAACTTVADLFPGPESEKPRRRTLLGKGSRDFQFLIDEALLADFEQEIRELASL